MQNWDELIAPRSSKCSGPGVSDWAQNTADIWLANTYHRSGAGLGLLSRLRATRIQRVAGDVWIADPRFNTSNAQLDPGFYGLQTLNHELGHSLGLSHPGDYNFGDDNDGDGVPDPITYEGDAFYFQDNHQYTIMSYFDTFEAGNNQVDWNLMRFVYPSTPMVHDVAVVQAEIRRRHDDAHRRHDLWLQRHRRRHQRRRCASKPARRYHLHHLGCRRQRHARPVGLLHAARSSTCARAPTAAPAGSALMTRRWPAIDPSTMSKEAYLAFVNANNAAEGSSAAAPRPTTSTSAAARAPTREFRGPTSWATTG